MLRIKQSPTIKILERYFVMVTPVERFGPEYHLNLLRAECTPPYVIGVTLHCDKKLHFVFVALIS